MTSSSCSFTFTGERCSIDLSHARYYALLISQMFDKRRVTVLGIFSVAFDASTVVFPFYSVSIFAPALHSYDILHNPIMLGSCCIIPSTCRCGPSSCCTPRSPFWSCSALPSGLCPSSKRDPRQQRKKKIPSPPRTRWTAKRYRSLRISKWCP